MNSPEFVLMIRGFLYQCLILSDYIDETHTHTNTHTHTHTHTILSFNNFHISADSLFSCKVSSIYFLPKATIVSIFYPCYDIACQ